MNVFQPIRQVIFILSVPVITVTVCILALLDTGIRKTSATLAQKYPRAWARIILSITGVKVRVSGVENLDPKATYIFAGNHTSQFDIYSFQAYCPHDFRWIAKKELFDIPIFGLTMQRVGSIPIDRSRGREALKSLNLAAKRIAAGSSVLIFPEGTRSKDGKLDEFKSGAFVLAIKSGVEVVPIGFNGAFSILPSGKLFPKSGEIIIRIGKPIPTRQYKTKDKQELACLTHREVAQLLDEHHLPSLEKN
jgi:1-acyl-sn-glycerol-3-phosphate acyltransferase